MNRTTIILVALVAVAFLASLVPNVVVAADAPKDGAATVDAPKDRVVVMYFHRTKRCPTCLKMGSYTEEAVKSGFAELLKEKKVELHFIDFQNEKNAALTKAYGIGGPTLLVAKVANNKVAEYKNLKEMWAKVGDKDAFLEYVQTSVKAYLK